MKLKTITFAVATSAAAGAFALGGMSLANAETTAPAPSTSSSAPASDAKPGKGAKGTPVTGDELAKVTAAVTAKDPAVTVARAHKEADGSYDVFGTKDGARVKFDVSADLKTVTQGAARPGKRGGGAPSATPSTSATG
jgi:hypothetical protein